MQSSVIVIIMLFSHRGEYWDKIGKIVKMYAFIVKKKRTGSVGSSQFWSWRFESGFLPFCLGFACVPCAEVAFSKLRKTCMFCLYICMHVCLDSRMSARACCHASVCKCFFTLHTAGLNMLLTNPFIVYVQRGRDNASRCSRTALAAKAPRLELKNVQLWSRVAVTANSASNKRWGWQSDFKMLTARDQQAGKAFMLLPGRLPGNHFQMWATCTGCVRENKIVDNKTKKSALFFSFRLVLHKLYQSSICQGEM